MRVLFAFNAFKGSLTAAQACDTASRSCAALGHEVRVCPMADGGDGTGAVVSAALKCATVSVGVSDPFGRSQIARYGWSYDTHTAVMEMASASGLALLRLSELDPMRASTFGTGQMIAHAITQKKAKHIIIGLGGSATVDGGLGCTQALGWKFADVEGNTLRDGLGGGDLSAVSAAFVPMGDAAVTHGVDIRMLCDVRNPLLGETGAARVFGPQKGASREQVALLDAGLRHWMVDVLRRADVAAMPGAGAAGGLAAGLVACCGATFADGARTVAKLSALDEAVQWADLVVTGEGMLDDQTLMGKAPAEVARLARAHGKALGLMCGRVSLMPDEIAQLGPNVHVVQIAPDDIPVEEAMATAQSLLRKSVRRVFQ